MVHRQNAGPLWLVLQQGLVPHLSLTAGVGEDQGALVGLHHVGHLVQQLQSNVSGPGQSRKGLGHGAFHLDVFVDVSLDNHALRRPNKRFQGRLRRRQRRAHPPHSGAAALCRGDVPNPRHGQFNLHSSFGPQKLMPLVHHHHAGVGQPLGAALLSHEDVQRLRCRDQNVGKGRPLPRLFLGRGVSGSGSHFPGQSQPLDHGTCRIGNVRGQRAQRRHPNQLDAFGGARRGRRMGQHVPHGRVGLPASRGGLKKAVLSLPTGLPHVPLKSLRTPAPLLKPSFERLVGRHGSLGRHGAQRNIVQRAQFKQHFHPCSRPCDVVLYLRHGLCLTQMQLQHLKP